MTERTDITVDWGISPRLAEVDLPSTELAAQDAHDTFNSNTLQPGMSDDSLDNMDDDPIISSAGKEDLGGGTSVGITSTLLDAQIAFARTDSRSTGTITTANAAGTRLIDSAADFVGDLVQRGDWVINFTDRSVTEVLEVIDLNTLRTRALSDGIDNQFDLTDSYKVWEVSECSLSGGNFVALDDASADINPLFTTFGRFATRTSSSSATLQSQLQLEAGLFNEGVAIHPIEGFNGTGYSPAGDPIGTRGAPSDNTTHAEEIAHSRFLNKYFIMASMSLGSGDGFGGEDHQVIGDSAINITLTVAAAADVSNCDFRNLTLAGAFDPGFVARESVIGNVTGINGHIYNCSLGGPIQLSEDVSIQGCWTKPEDGLDLVTIDFNSQAVDCDISGFQGGRLEIKNMVTGSSLYGTGNGHIEFHASCTGGIVRLFGGMDWQGDMTVFEEFDDDTIHTLASKYLERAVWVDTEAVASGNGSQKKPYNTLTAAVDFAETEHIKKLHIYADITLDRQVKNFILNGVGIPTVDCNGQTMTKTELSHCRLEGISLGGITIQQSVLLPSLEFSGFAEKCAIAGDITINGPTHIIESYSNKAGSGYANITTGANELQVSDWHRSMGIVGMTGGTHTIEMYGGQLHLDPTCIGGTIYLRGNYSLPPNDLSNGTVLIDQTETRSTWNHAIDGAYTAEDIVKITAAALGGKASGLDTLNPTFRDLSDTKDVIAAITDQRGNRSSVTVDVS